MDRLEIIEAINANRERAIGLGFDWPTADIYSEPTDELYAFLWEIEEFLQEQ